MSPDLIQTAGFQAFLISCYLLNRTINFLINYTARVFKNNVADQVLEIEAKPGATKFEDIQALVAGVKGRELFESGDLDNGIWSAGMVVGLIDDIPSCEELITRIVEEADAIINKRLGKMASA